MIGGFSHLKSWRTISRLDASLDTSRAVARLKGMAFFMQSVLGSLALLAIRGYKRYISPHKGFSCAYRVQRGGRSCSTLGFRAIRRFGFFGGLAVLRQRTSRCAEVAAQARARRDEQEHQSSLHAGGLGRLQRGSCDVPCDVPCDGKDMSCGSRANWLNLCDCCSCLDWPRRKADRRQDPAKRAGA